MGVLDPKTLFSSKWGFRGNPKIFFRASRKTRQEMSGVSGILKVKQGRS